MSSKSNMAETSKVNECELLKIEKMRTCNERMIELGLQPERYLGEQISSSKKNSPNVNKQKELKRKRIRPHQENQ